MNRPFFSSLGLAFAFVLGLVVAGCGSSGSSDNTCCPCSNPAPMCGTDCTSLSCDQGYYCENDECTNQCTRDGHCTGGQICNASGRCVDPSANTGPCGREPPHADCGIPCNPTFGCPSEFFYCEGGVCGSDCDATSGCVAGEMCASNGRCVPYEPPRDMSVADLPPGESCPNVNVTAEGVPPNVLVLLDRSSSMTTNVPGTSPTQNRRQVAVAAINNMITNYGSQVRFGLAFFPGANYSCGTGNGGDCHPGYVDVGTAAGTGTTIATRLTGYGNCMLGTPIGPALSALTSYAGLEDTTRDNVVVLLTDGDQSGCSGDAPGTGAANLFSQNPSIRTFAIGFAEGDPAELNSVAQNGGTERVPGMNTGMNPPADYYAAVNQAELAAAFDDIITNVISCDLTLSGQLANVANACADGNIELNGSPLACQGTNCAASSGWCVVDSDTIRLLGTDCATFQNTSGANVSGSFRCGTIISPP